MNLQHIVAGLINITDSAQLKLLNFIQSRLDAGDSLSQIKAIIIEEFHQQGIRNTAKINFYIYCEVLNEAVSFDTQMSQTSEAVARLKEILGEDL